MNRALSTWIGRSQRGSSCASTKSGCTNTSRRSPTVRGDDSSAHAPDDRSDEHQDRYEVEDEEAPLPMRLHALASQDSEASEQELDRNSENEQPSEPDEELAS
jgi:hypothetical protein